MIFCNHNVLHYFLGYVITKLFIHITLHRYANSFQSVLWSSSSNRDAQLYTVDIPWTGSRSQRVDGSSDQEHRTGQETTSVVEAGGSVNETGKSERWNVGTMERWKGKHKHCEFSHGAVFVTG